MDSEKGASWIKVSAENRQLKEVLAAFRDYDEALQRLDVCAYKYDQQREVDKKKKVFYEKYQKVNLS